MIPRRSHESTGREGPGVWPVGSSVPLKPPVWTWEIPAYFFIGGAAGVSAVIALVASFSADAARTELTARLVAATGAAVSPLLLISDLGRPSRFLFMLRVFKPTSAMSVGVWTLIVFTTATFSALGLAVAAPASTLVTAARLGFDGIAAASGLVFATYTGVLLGATVVPVWAARHRRLPFEFGVSSLGAAAAIVEVFGGFTPALNRIATAAAVIKTALWLIDRRQAARETDGRTLIEMSMLLAGPLALGLRTAGLAWLPARVAAAACAIAGSVILRYGWMAAGRESAASVRK